MESSNRRFIGLVKQFTERSRTITVDFISRISVDDCRAAGIQFLYPFRWVRTAFLLCVGIDIRSTSVLRLKLLVTDRTPCRVEQLHPIPASAEVVQAVA